MAKAIEFAFFAGVGGATILALHVYAATGWACPGLVAK